MKTIQPISIWINGQLKQATKFQMAIIQDNLLDVATFYWKLFSVGQEDSLEQVSQGNLTISGEDYQNWDASSDVNDAAYQWGATQLGLTIVA